MNTDNIVKIGNALNWRNTFDIDKKYYQENIITACGCVFRCKVLQAQGKSPIKSTDKSGHIVYANTDVWDVIVDMAYYYNFAIDTQEVTKETLEYVKKLDKAFQKQQQEIKALQSDNKKQWERIQDIEKLNTEQQREIDSVIDTVSCFSEGIWFDTLLWSNEPLWDNNKYAVTDDLQQQITQLTNKHNNEVKAINNHIAEHETAQAEYEKTTDAKLLVLSLGAKTTLTISPNVIYKGVETSITLKASINIDDAIDNLILYRGQQQIASSKEHTLSHPVKVSTFSDIQFRAETHYKGLILPISAVLYARYPIYCGFGSNINDVKNDAHKLSARTSAAGTYKARNTKNSQRYYILVPSDISALSNFTMGGAPYVMNSRKETIDKIEYKVYESGAVYDANAEVNITAK